MYESQISQHLKQVQSSQKWKQNKNPKTDMQSKLDIKNTYANC